MKANPTNDFQRPNKNCFYKNETEGPKKIKKKKKKRKPNAITKILQTI